MLRNTTDSLIWSGKRICFSLIKIAFLKICITIFFLLLVVVKSTHALCISTGDSRYIDWLNILTKLRNFNKSFSFLQKLLFSSKNDFMFWKGKINKVLIWRKIEKLSISFLSSSTWIRPNWKSFKKKTHLILTFLKDNSLFLLQFSTHVLLICSNQDSVPIEGCVARQSLTAIPHYHFQSNYNTSGMLIK